MGRLSQKPKNNSLLVAVYDQWQQDEADTQQLIEIIQTHISGLQHICELACGSGTITAGLISDDVHLLASDLDLNMLDQAKAKLNHPNLTFQQANMVDFDFEKIFDAIVVANDSVNFLEDIDQLTQFAQRCYRHLPNNGKVLFDVHSITRLDYFKKPYIETGMIDELGYEYEISTADQHLIHTITWYQDAYPIQEQLTQRVFNKDEICKAFNLEYWNVEFESIDDIDHQQQKWFVKAIKKK